MAGLRPEVDPDGLLEYSVVFTDRSLNSMSKSFQQVMNDISSTLCDVYKADAAVVVPGGGTFGMEAVARQFATDQKCLVVRNGWFSFRWSQICEMGNLPKAMTIMRARQAKAGDQEPFTPAPIEEVTARIAEEKPAVVFAPHVETSAGMMLPDDYMKALADAAHAVGALFVLDCVASGCMWVDMREIGVDVLITAPQKGWSASPAAGLVMLSQRAIARLDETTSNSFAVDLKKWHQIMQAYVNGGHAYHATMPTDALRTFRDTMIETREKGFGTYREAQITLGRRIRDVLEARGFVSVAGEGFQAPGVVVSYTDDPNLQNGSRFAAEGVQIAAGVPLEVGEPDGFRTFRIGLFGHDKLMDVDGAVSRFEAALDRVIARDERKVA
ncbi:MAG: aminotransferase class V-fold PLP-dependent enzyme [Pseudomonadota bacterium]